jgi:spoIIIJ-associated protein
MEWRTAEGTSYEEAVASLLKTLGADRSEVEIEDLGETRKMFGLGSLATKVRGRLKDDAVSGERKGSQRTERTEKPHRGEYTDRKERVERKEYPPLSDEELSKIGKESLAFLREIVEKMNISHGAVNMSAEGGLVTLSIEDGNEPFPIGRNGEVLDALQTLMGIFVGKFHEGKAKVIVDAGSFREKRLETLKELALKSADEAVTKGKKIYLGPMKAGERKAIHAALQDNGRVVTKSQGEGDHRQVVVMPVSKK